MNITFDKILTLENEGKILNAENTEGEDYIVFRGFFGNSLREIFANVLLDKNLDLNVKINPDTKKKSFFFEGSYYKYFLSKELINSKDRVYWVGDNISSVLYMVGYLSDSKFNMSTSGTIATLIGKSVNYLIGATDSGDKVHGEFFRPLTEEERKVNDIEKKRKVKLDNVPLITIKPIPDIPNELVEEQIKDFEKVKKDQEKRYQKINEDDFRRLENLGPKINIDDISKKLKESNPESNSETESNSYRFSIFNEYIYIHVGDFNYKKQIDDIIENFNFDLAEKMARVFYTEKNSPLADNSSLKEVLKRSGLSALERVSMKNNDICTCGVMTAYNNGGILSLEFNPLPYESFCPDEIKEKSLSLKELFKI